jgi:hypothetical protein
MVQPSSSHLIGAESLLPLCVAISDASETKPTQLFGPRHMKSIFSIGVIDRTAVNGRKLPDRRFFSISVTGNHDELEQDSGLIRQCIFALEALLN